MAIYAEGKEHALAVGVTKMSTKDIREASPAALLLGCYSLPALASAARLLAAPIPLASASAYWLLRCPPPFTPLQPP